MLKLILLHKIEDNYKLNKRLKQILQYPNNKKKKLEGNTKRKTRRKLFYLCKE